MCLYVVVCMWLCVYVLVCIRLSVSLSVCLTKLETANRKSESLTPQQTLIREQTSETETHKPEIIHTYPQPMITHTYPHLKPKLTNPK